MKEIGKKSEVMKPGTFFITFTRKLPSEEWTILEYERMLMSWGEVTVYIQQKKP